MIGYIRDPRTWSAVKTVTVTSYELPLETAQGETGKVTILGQLDADYSRYVFSLDNMDYVFKITGQQTGDIQETTLTLSDSISCFEDCVSFIQTSDVPSSYTQSTIATGMMAQLEDVDVDGTGRHNVTTSVALRSNCNFAPVRVQGKYKSGVTFQISTSELGGTEYGSHTTFLIENVLRVLRNNGVSVSVTIGEFKKLVYVQSTSSWVTIRYSGVLTAYLDAFGFDACNIVFGDGHSFVISESYNDNICTAVYLIDPNDTITDRQYFLTVDGEISQSFENQAQGFRVIAEFDRDAYSSPISQANAIFDQNKRNFKIEFASDKKLHIGQQVKLALNRGVLDAVINKVMLKSGDDRYYYTCGELPVTATERIKADGWTYGSRLPSNPRKGQLFIEV